MSLETSFTQVTGSSVVTPVVAADTGVVETLRQAAVMEGVPVTLVGVRRDGSLVDEAPRIDAVLRSGGIDNRVLLALLRAHPSIRWVHLPSAGADSVMIPEVLERDITITRTRGVHGPPVAEFAMALILAAAKRLRAFLEAQQRAEWLDETPSQVAGTTLTVVGYGEIGQEVARRARAFDMRVIGVRRRPEPDDLADQVVGMEGLHAALGAADYVVLVLPGTPSTRGLFGAAELRAMQAHAYLVNVGRGEVVDEDALEAALREGRPAGALLDTLATEPLPADHPLWRNPRVVITPHAAGVRTAGLAGVRLTQVVENIRRLGQGQPLLNQVDRVLGY